MQAIGEIQPARVTINDNRQQVTIVAFSDRLAALHEQRREELREVGVESRKTAMVSLRM